MFGLNKYLSSSLFPKFLSFAMTRHGMPWQEILYQNYFLLMKIINLIYCHFTSNTTLLDHLNIIYILSFRLQMSPLSVQLSRSVVSDSLWPHELQHARPPCPSLNPRVHPNSCASSWWCHPAISSSIVHFSSCPAIPPSIRVFSNESTLCMRWPKYWSFSFSTSPSNEHSGLVFL